MASRLLVFSGFVAVAAIVAAAVAVLASGGAGEEAPSAQASPAATAPTAEASPTPVPTATPDAIAGVQRLPVRWVDVPDVLDFGSAQEVERPFANERMPDVQFTYFVAGLDGTSRQVYSTYRLLRDLTWDSNGLVATLWTQRAVDSSVAEGVVLPWQVETKLDPAGGKATDRFETLPLDCSPCSLNQGLMSLIAAHAGAGMHLLRDANGKRMLVTLYYDNGLNALDRPPFLIDSSYLVAADGSSKRLDGLTEDLWGLSWLPNAKALRGSGGVAFGDYPDAYFIPPQTGDALFLAKLRGLGIEAAGDAQGGPVGSRAVFAYDDPNGAQGPGNYLAVFDSNDWSLRKLGPAPPGFLLSSSRPPTVYFYWPAGSERFLAGFEGDAVLVDANTGARQPGSREDLQPPAGPTEVLSQSGRYAASFDDLKEGLLPAECAGLPQGLSVTDKQTGQTKTLLSCEGGSSGRAVWVNDTTLAARIYPYKFGDSDIATVVLIDITTGSVKTLVDVPEEGARVVPSPDGAKLLVTGTSLRLFDASGNLLEDYGGLTEGTQYKAFAWSPDGASFAYVVGPVGFPPGQ
jgi:hypothetical protein